MKFVFSLSKFSLYNERLSHCSDIYHAEKIMTKTIEITDNKDNNIATSRVIRGKSKMITDYKDNIVTEL